MYNAIIDDEHLNPTGIYKERLSQSRARRRDAPGHDGGGARRPIAGSPDRGMQLPLRQRRRDRADRGPGPRPAAAVHRGRAHRRPVRLRRHRHPVPAGPQGPGARLRPGRGPAQRRATGRRSGRVDERRRAVRRAGRSRTSTRSTRARRSTRLVTNRVWTRARAGSGDDPPRRALGRAVRRRLRVGLRDLRRGAAGAPRRRLRRRRERAPAADVLPPRRRHHQGHQPARRDRLEPRLHHGRRAPRRPRPRRRSSSCRPRRPSAAGRRPRRSGRSCTRSSTA